MGISSATIRSDYDGDGATAAFAVGFKYYDPDHVTVVHVDSSGVETTWTRGSEYTLSGDGEAITGQVDVDTSPTDYTPASGEKLVVLLRPPNKQEILLPSGNYLDDIEKGLDINVQQVLNLLDGNNRALQAPLSESSIGNLPTVAARKGKLLSFDETTGEPEAVAAADLDLATISAYMATFLGDDTAAEARATLDAAALTVANTFTKTQTWFKGADVASAAALSLGAGNWFDVTGTTAITSIDTLGVGTLVLLQFDDALTLTHHATDLILPGGANITTAAGDIALFYEYATGDWRCISYQRASGMPVDQYVGYDLIQTQTVSSAVASVNFTTGISSDYDDLLLILTNITPATDDSEFWLRFSDDGGATFEADASDYEYYSDNLGSDGSGEQESSTGATKILLCSDNVTRSVGNGAAEGWSGRIWVNGHSSASKRCTATYIGHYVKPNGAMHFTRGAGSLVATSAVDGLRILFDSGNIASGTASLYGLRKS